MALEIKGLQRIFKFRKDSKEVSVSAVLPMKLKIKG